MLVEHQRAEFEPLGVVRLTGVLSCADAARMRDRVWEALASEHGIRRDEPATWTIDQPLDFGRPQPPSPNWRCGPHASLAVPCSRAELRHGASAHAQPFDRAGRMVTAVRARP